MSYIAKINDGDNIHLVGSSLYGVCETAAETISKIAVLPEFDELITGVTVHIKFTNTNTAENPTLNVNNTGDKAIMRYGTTAPSTSASTSWIAGQTVSLTYDGNYWQMNDYTIQTPQTATVTSVAGKTGAVELNYPDIKPISEKEYPAYTISENNLNNGTLFFGKVNITDQDNYYTPWRVHYKLTVTTSENLCVGSYDCDVGMNGSTVTYYNYNDYYSTSYKPINNHDLLYPKLGYSSNGGYIGAQIHGAYNNTTLARTFKVEILEVVGCTVDILDDLTKYVDLYNSTYYTNVAMGTTIGLQESGDTDTGQYYLRYYTLKASSAITAASIIVGNADGYFNLNSGVAFDITYPVLYAGSAITAASTGSNNYIFHYAISVANTQSITLTPYKNVYIQGVLSGNTFFPISTAPLTQTVPTGENGRHYIYIGRAYSNTSLSFDCTSMRIFAFKKNAFVEVSGDATTVNGHTVRSDVPSNAKFNDFDTYATATTDEAGRWTVTIPNIQTLYEGLTIRVRLSTNFNDIFNTLNLNNLGEQLVWFRQGEKLTNQFPVNSIIDLTYVKNVGSYSVATNYYPLTSYKKAGEWKANTKYTNLQYVTYSGITFRCKTAHTSGSTFSSTFWIEVKFPTSTLAASKTASTSVTDGWICQTTYDSGNAGDYNHRPYYAAYYTGTNPLYRYKLCVIDVNGKIQPLSLEDTTGTTKTPLSVPFKPDMIYYYNSTTEAVANHSIDVGSLYTAYSIDGTNYTFNSTLTANRDLYLVGTLDGSTGLFTLDTTSATSWYLMVTTNTNNLNLSTYFSTSKQYILVGRTYGTSNKFALYQENPLYFYNGTGLVRGIDYAVIAGSGGGGGDGTTVYVQSDAPTSPKDGDLWYEILT